MLLYVQVVALTLIVQTLIGEPVGKLSERTVDQSGRDNKLHLFKHAN